MSKFWIAIIIAGQWALGSSTGSSLFWTWTVAMVGSVMPSTTHVTDARTDTWAAQGAGSGSASIQRLISGFGGRPSPACCPQIVNHEL